MGQTLEHEAGEGEVGADLEVKGEEAIADEAVVVEAGLEEVGVELEAVGEGGGGGAGLEEGGVEDGFRGEAAGFGGLEEGEGLGEETGLAEAEDFIHIYLLTKK